MDVFWFRHIFVLERRTPWEKAKNNRCRFFAILLGKFSITRYAGSAGTAANKATVLSSFAADVFYQKSSREINHCEYRKIMHGTVVKFYPIVILKRVKRVYGFVHFCLNQNNPILNRKPDMTVCDADITLLFLEVFL